MNPDVAAAADRLGPDGILTPAQAAYFGRAARREIAHGGKHHPRRGGAGARRAWAWHLLVMARARGGFTAERLFEDASARGTMELAAALATFSPAARTPAAPPDRLDPGGGRFGGGGASESY